MSSRLLILALTLVAVTIGGVNLALTAPDAVRAVHNQLDGQLARAAKVLPAALEASTARSLGLAAEVAADTAVKEALAAARKDGKLDQEVLDQVLGSADKTAERLDRKEIRSLVVVATGTGAAVFRQGADNQFGEESGVPLVKEALGGSRGSVLTTIGDAVYRLAAVPVGSDGAPVGALALGFQVDDAFARELRDALGAEVTILHGGKILATSLGAEERGPLPAAADGASAGATFTFGELPEETFSLFGLVKLPLLAEATGLQRGQVVRVPGLEGAEVIVSASSVAALAPLADGQKTHVLLTGVLLVVGLLFAGLARGRGAGYDAEDVEGLADVAERAAGGDLTARAAEFLPGDLGRVARALNKLAAKAARPAAPAAPAASHGESERDAGALADQFPFGDVKTAGPSAGPTFAEPVTAGPSAGPVPAEAQSAGPSAGPTFGAFDTAGPSAGPVFAEAQSAGPAAGPVFGEVHTAGPSAGPAFAEAQSAGPAAGPAFGDVDTAGPSLGGARSAGPAYGEAPQHRTSTVAWERPNTVQPGAPILGGATARAEDDFSGLADDKRQDDADAFAQALRDAGQGQEGGFNPDATVVAAIPDALLRATARAAAPQRPAAPPVDPDEAHFQQVFREFLATRERCGESVGALTWEKFHAKLQKNREQLVAKYGCRTVRFTVYVKEGKAALKAAPVRD